MIGTGFYRFFEMFFIFGFKYRVVSEIEVKGLDLKDHRHIAFDAQNC